MATPGRTEKRLSGRHADFRPRARPCVGAGGFAKRSLSPPMGWQRGRARRGDDAVPRAGRLPDPRTAMSIHGHMMVPSPGGADVSGSMRSLLRASTVGLHAAVDSRFAPMLDAGEAGYRSFLLASAAAVFPLEHLCSRRGWARSCRTGRGEPAPRPCAPISPISASPTSCSRQRRRSRERPACSACSMSSKDPGSAPGCWSPICSRAAARGFGPPRVTCVTARATGCGNHSWRIWNPRSAVRDAPARPSPAQDMAFALFIAGRPEAGLRARRVAAETADAD